MGALASPAGRGSRKQAITRPTNTRACNRLSQQVLTGTGHGQSEELDGHELRQAEHGQKSGGEGGIYQLAGQQQVDGEPPDRGGLSGQTDAVGQLIGPAHQPLPPRMLRSWPGEASPASGH